MVVLHTSDLHGNWRLPMQFQDFDVWANTGDTFPNVSRGASIESTFQRAWLSMDRKKLRRVTMPHLRDRYGPGDASHWYPPKSRQPPSSGSIAAELTAWLRGRPLVCVPGNHDYADLAGILAQHGAKTWDVTKGPVEIGGLVFSGLREVPWMAGEWAGEAHDFRGPVDRAMAADPHVLLTHSPPMGVLDLSAGKGGRAGIPYLTSYLSWRPHRVRLVLMGHIHEQPGVVEEMGIVFSNAAQTARIIEVP